MNKQFSLEPGETVLKRSAEVGYGGAFSGNKNELILTDQRIILQKKNLLGKVSGALCFSLSDIIISNDQAQVRLGQKDIVTPTLDIYFRTGMESFRFTWEDEVKDWANEINTLLTGQPPIYPIKNWMDDMKDLENMAAAFTGTVKSVKAVFGIKETTSCKCPACGASITGVTGETVACPYCGTYHTFT